MSRRITLQELCQANKLPARLMVRRLDYWREKQFLPAARGAGRHLDYDAHDFAIIAVLCDVQNGSAHTTRLVGGSLLSAIVAEVRGVPAGAGTATVTHGPLKVTVRLRWPEAAS